MVGWEETEQPRAPLRLAAIFYAVLVAVALAWTWLAGRSVADLFWRSGHATPLRWTLGVAGGVALGVSVILLSRVLLRHTLWARELYEWFASLLGPVGRRRAIALAALSSVGEEMLFRGAMQTAWGVYPSALIFGLAHLPPRWRLLPWTMAAVVIGVLLGWLTEASGSLAGAIIAHFLINAVNLRLSPCLASLSSRTR